jgi:hypothetical protein
MRTGAVQRDVHIGRVVQNAIVFDLKNWRAGVVSSDNLVETVAQLFRLLRERRIEYLLVGGVALLQYIEGRNTEDIDLIMALTSLKKVPEIRITSRSGDFLRGEYRGLRVDVLLARNRLFNKVRRRYAVLQRFAEQEIPCAAVEGLILLKLYALPSLYRQGDFARVALYEGDLATLIQAYQPALEPLLDELAAHLSETDLAAVRETIAEIEQRIERFTQRRETF